MGRFTVSFGAALASAALGAALACAVLAAAPAAARPECTDTGPTTTHCRTNGSSQIVTSPPAMNYGPFYGWPVGGVVIGFGW